MARFFLRSSMQGKILLVVTCALTSLWLQTPIATAQHRGGHPGGGGVPTGAPHVFVPPASHPPIPRPPLIAGPHPLGADARFRFRPRPINVFVFRRRFFFGAPCFGFGVGFGCNSFWWPNWNLCWGWGFYCNTLPFTGYEFENFENYVTLQPYEVPVYLYGPGPREQVWLYLKDGTGYSVDDYWFVNGQVHFIAFEEGGAKSVERVIGFDELDLQKTIDVNTRRGFRVVMRDAPLEQYMRDHPDATPPLLQPSQKN